LRYPLDELREVPSDLVLVRKSQIWGRTVFSAGSGMEAPVLVEVLAHQSRDKPFFGDIVGQGPGAEQHGVRNPMIGRRGSIMLSNDNMISYRVNEKGAVLYLFRNSCIMALMNPETFQLTPVQHYILCRTGDAESMTSTPERRVTVEQRVLALTSRGDIWLPTTEMETDDESSRFNEGLRAEYGEVVLVGPGRWHEGEFQQPSCKPGDILLYDCSHSTLSVTIRGDRFTLVACTQEALVYRGTARTSPDAL
jgi:co-chaperonin GroES (HSP10)